MPPAKFLEATSPVSIDQMPPPFASRFKMALLWLAFGMGYVCGQFPAGFGWFHQMGQSEAAPNNVARPPSKKPVSATAWQVPVNHGEQWTFTPAESSLTLCQR